MSAKPGLLLFGAPSSEAEAPLTARVEPLFEVHLQPALADALASVQRLSPAVVAVDLRRNAEAAFAAIEKLHRHDPELPLVALHDQKDPDLILKAMRCGVHEFVLTTQGDELSRVFGKLAREARTGRATGTVVSIFPSKGGLGATTVATNLAGQLLHGNRRVVLVDLDFQMGDALVFLDVASRYTIRDVLTNAHRLDTELLSASLTRHASGLFVLAQPDLLGDAEEPTAKEVSQLLGFLAQHFDYVVCDGLRRFDERTVAALDASQRVLVLLAQNVPAIRNGHRTLEVFRRLGYGTSKVSLVVNRYLKSEEIALADITQQLSLPVTGAIANDYRTVSAAVNKGQLLQDASPRARVTEDLRQLALTVAGGEKPKAEGGFLKSLFGSRAEGARHGTERAPQAG